MKTDRLTRLIFSVVLMFLLNVGNAQEKTDESKIKAIAEKACKCTEEISVELPRDTVVAKINSCITAEIVAEQTNKQMEDLLGLAKEAIATSPKKDTTVVGEGKRFTIYADKDFDEIQADMFENCPSVKYLMSSNNVKSEFSMSKNKKALKFYQEGQDYSTEGKYEMAIVSFNKAVKADSKFAFAWDNLGISYRRIGNYKEAVRCYEKSLEIDPNGSMPMQNLAVAYEYLRDYDKAGQAYERLIKAYPDNPEGYYGCGRAYYFAENYEKAVNYMFKAYKMYNEAKSPYVNDASKTLDAFYNDLKEKGKLDIFYAAAKKNNIEIQE